MCLERKETALDKIVHVEIMLMLLFIFMVMTMYSLLYYRYTNYITISSSKLLDTNIYSIWQVKPLKPKKYPPWQFISPKDHISTVIQLAVIPWWSVCTSEVTIVFVIPFTVHKNCTRLLQTKVFLLWNRISALQMKIWAVPSMMWLGYT